MNKKPFDYAKYFESFEEIPSIELKVNNVKDALKTEYGYMQKIYTKANHPIVLYNNNPNWSRLVNQIGKGAVLEIKNCVLVDWTSKSGFKEKQYRLTSDSSIIIKRTQSKALETYYTAAKNSKEQELLKTIFNDFKNIRLQYNRLEQSVKNYVSLTGGNKK